MSATRIILLLLSLTLTVAAADLPASYYGEIAQVQAAHGLQREAAASFRQAIALETDGEQAWTWRAGLAEALTALGDRQAAATLAQAMAGSGDPLRSGQGEMMLAADEAASGRSAEAASRLERVALDCSIASLRASACRKLGDLPEAMTSAVLVRARQTLASAPALLPALELLLALDRDHGRQADALDAAAAASPEDLDLVRRCCDAQVAAGRPALAEELLLRLRRDFPGLAPDLDQALARVAMARGDVAAAAATALASAEGMADDVRRSLYLARTFKGLGLWAQAEPQAKTAVARAASQGAAMQAAVAIEYCEILHHLGRAAEVETLLQPLANQELWPGIRARARSLLGQPSPDDLAME